jgi:hypothetical protein
MTERIASGEIHVEVNDREALASLRRIDSEFERTMRDIDRESATVDIDADVRGLKRSLRDAEREVKEYNKRIEAAESERSKAQLRRFQAQKQAAVEQAKRELDAARARLSQQQAENKQHAVTDKRLAAITKRDEARARVEAKAAQARERQQRQELRLREQNERAMLREQSAEERRARQREREIRDVPRLEQAYLRLHDKLDKLAEARRKARRPFDERAMLKITVEEDIAKGEIERIRDEVRRRVGREPIEIPVKPELGRRWGEHLRVEFGRNNGVLTAVAASVGLNIGHNMRGGIQRGLNRGLTNVAGEAVKGLGGAALRGLLTVTQRIGHAAAGLADSTIRLGPFTTTIRKAIVGLSLFAPIILDVIGALGALTGSVGAATLGLGALGTAVVGGGIPAMLGMGLVIKQVIGEFSDVAKAQKAYDDALQKGNTDLAAKKLKELKAVMGNVSDETVKQIGLWDKVQSQFKRDTAPARASVWKLIGEGIQTASDLLPMFTRRTNEAMDVAERGLSGWMRGLRSAGGRSALDEMMGNFNASLGPALDGMGSLLAYFGRVGQIASRVLPGMAKDFRDWADGVNSVDTHTLEGKVDRVIGSLRAVGRFLLSGGRLMKAFFGAGVDSGNDFLDTMTQAMDGWTAWINSVEGQESLGDFFDEAIDGTRALWNTLQPVVSSFVRWAANIAPFSRAFFEGAAAIAAVVGELLELTALRTPVTALVTTLGALWAIGKIRAATTALYGFTTALLGISAAGRAAGAAGAAGGVIDLLTGRRGKGGLGTLGKVGAGAAIADLTLDFADLGNNVDDAGRKTGRTRGILAALSGAAVKAAPTLLRLGTVAGIAGTAALLFGGEAKTAADRANELTEAANELSKGVKEGAEQSSRAFNVLADSSLGLRQGKSELRAAQKEVDRLTRQGKTGSAEYAAALDRLNQALSSVTQMERARRRAMEAVRQVNQLLTGSTEGTTRAMEAQNKAAEEARRWIDLRKADDVEDITGKKIWQLTAEDIAKYGDQLPIIEGREEEFAEALDATKSAIQAVTSAREADIKAAAQQMTNAANLQRGLKGFRALGQQAGDTMVRLAKAIGGSKTMEIAIKFPNPRQVQGVMRAMNAAIRSGTPGKRVFDVVANSKTAEEAMRKLNRIKITPKRLEIIEDGGDKALRMIRRLTGTKMPQKVLDIIGSDRDAKAKVKALIRMGIPKKTALMLGDNRDALRKAREANSQKLTPLWQRILRNIVNPAGLFSNLSPIIQPVLRKVKNLFADGGMYASGGPASQPDPRKQERAARTADLSGNPRRAVSQKVNKPTYLTGEEATPEVIVSTNPKYRKRNQHYAALAARMVGLQTVDPSTGLPIQAADGYAGGNFARKGKGPAFHPDKEINRKRKFKPSKKAKAKFKATRSWNSYVANLETQQGYWEREVSIRESKVREPEDTIVRDPAKDKVVVDPVSGEQTKVEAYKANPKIESQYKPDLQHVINAMNTLMAIVKELVRAIPLAISANRQEYSHRSGSIDWLEDKARKEKGKLRDAKKEDKPKHRRRIDAWEAEIERHRTEQRALNQDRDALKEKRVDAGFDWREYMIQRGDYIKEKQTAQPDAKAEAQEQTEAGMPDAGTGGGSGDGSGSDAGAGGLSYSQQAAIADSAKANILKEFGSNFSTNTSGTPGGVGGAGTGAGQSAQGGLAALANVGTSGGGVAADLTAGRQAMASSASASAAVAGGPSGSSGAAGGVGATTNIGGDKTIIVEAKFATVPPDPHTFVKGVEFEVGGIL